MKIIDADKLTPDDNWDGYEDRYTAYSEFQVKHAPSAVKKRYVICSQGIEIGSFTKLADAKEYVRKSNEAYDNYYQYCLDNHERPADNRCDICLELTVGNTIYYIDTWVEKEL